MRRSSTQKPKSLLFHKRMKTRRPSLPPSLPLDLPLLVGTRLWARQEKECPRGGRRSSLLPSFPPSLLGWKLLVLATELDPLGSWLVRTLTHPSSPPSSLPSSSPMFWMGKKAGRGGGGGQGGREGRARVVWRAKHMLQQGVDGKEGKSVDLALCVKTTPSTVAASVEKEAAHALLYHLPAPSYAAALGEEGGREGLLGSKTKRVERSGWEGHSWDPPPSHPRP